MLERDFQNIFRILMSKQFVTSAVFGKRGEADLMLMANNIGHWVELKVGKNKQQQNQREFETLCHQKSQVYKTVTELNSPVDVYRDLKNDQLITNGHFDIYTSSDSVITHVLINGRFTVPVMAHAMFGGVQVVKDVADNSLLVCGLDELVSDIAEAPVIKVAARLLAEKSNLA